VKLIKRLETNPAFVEARDRFVEQAAALEAANKRVEEAKAAL